MSGDLETASLHEKLVGEAQAALDAGDRELAKELAWQALDCGQEAEEPTGLRPLLETLEGHGQAPGPDGSDVAEQPLNECDTAAAPTSAVMSDCSSAATAELLSRDEAKAFAAFLERGGAAALDAELASENDSECEAPTPSHRRDRDEDDPFDQEELRRQRTNRVAKLVFGSLAGCVILGTGWVVVDAVAEAPLPRAECMSEGRPPAIAMPSLGGSGAVTPRDVTTTEIDRILARQRIEEASSRGEFELAAEQRTVAANGSSGGDSEGLTQGVELSERVGSMVPAGGTDAAPTFVKPQRPTGAGASSPQSHPPRTAGRRASRPSGDAPRASGHRSVGGGRFFATDMTSQVKSVHVAEQTPRLQLPVGQEIKAVLDLGITSLRHGEVLARVEQTVAAGNVSVPRGAMLVGSSENDRKRIYVMFTKAVIDGKPLALRAMAIDGKMPGLVPIRREVTLEERQSAEIAKGALDVVGEIAKRGVGSIGGRAIDGVTQESKRDQEVDRTVVLSVPAGRTITVKVLP